MYIPTHFRQTDRATIDAFIHDNGFGALISVVGGEVLASHLPFLYDTNQGLLLGHLARVNPQWRTLGGATDVRVILQGPHAYVSPTWYAKPSVPTWNYAAVHIRGRAEVFDEPQRLHALVEALSRKYEAGGEAPWNGANDRRMLEQIVGVSIRIEEIEASFKLSQNKSRADRERVSRELRRPAPSEAQRVADLMDAQP